MSDIPIIFSGPMVRALLDGRKTMTRRLAWRPDEVFQDGTVSTWKTSPWQKVKPGDRLWVRESILQSLVSNQYPSGEWESSWSSEKIEYLADEPTPQKRFLRPDTYGSPWMQSRPSIHMPRWASRLTLTVTATKIERLQDISEEDAQAEGARRFDSIPLDPVDCVLPDLADRWSMENPATTGACLASARLAFANYWIKLHGRESWDANPEVVALTFIVAKANIDAVKP
jgi:hypothetical protein